MDAAQTLTDALSASFRLVQAVPVLAARHSTWALAFTGTSEYSAECRARLAITHVDRLARAAAAPAVVQEPGTRFAGDLDDATITPVP
ncbi:hypothetical protein KIN34_06415 [Cellulomonas sp. DKR-3]|uniref:Uncharacterized protein n=1 Tax=Cellulomonas fulva TaxID=2835530 RepID=A0ABS5TXP0_9CELL|nr:hypothetical protein [Cellulomonas fulva]MBT0993919.1 hypothetical protein [Cellulomonas fulva]